VIFATVGRSFSPPETAPTFSVSLCLLYNNHGGDMTHIDQDLSAALYLLGFSLLRGDLGEIAEIKGDMAIKLVHPPGEELKFVVELPGEKQMIFSVDRHQIVDLAESLKLTRN
jgi:hypothetical protein